MSEEVGTYTVTKDQYNHLVERLKELEHLPRALEMANARAERWKRRHDLLVTAHEKLLAAVELGDDLQKAKAGAWEEGYQRGLRDAEQDLQHGADNPYREAEVYLTHPPGAELGITVDGDD